MTEHRTKAESPSQTTLTAARSQSYSTKVKVARQRF